eukprot:TRINITY_DN1349_c0_g1_i10.p1 TRINITY_DN1349_c0_g1~~TRINITY_DN1349_c0_g1_i10.p1  ORF type:complete len:119 (+),score=24.95 TRINITY_DN1349_c0_g1_i10:619-975(+)
MLRKKRGLSAERISRYDVERAVQKLEILGNSYKVIKYGDRLMIQSVPFELNSDHTTVLALAPALGYLTVPMIQEKQGWASSRIALTLNQLLTEGMIWIDDQEPDGVIKYWFPSLQEVF